MKESKVRPFIPAVICVILAIVILIASYIIQYVYYQPSLLQLQMQQRDIQTQIEQSKAVKQQKESDLAKAVSGLNTERVRTDDVIAQKFLKKVLTWDSYDEYEAMRENVLAEYADILSDDSQFVTLFLPNAYVTDGAGNQCNIIDATSANMSYDSMKSYVTNITSDETYTYTTEVTVSSTVYGKSEVGTAVFIYSIDKNGDFLSMNGFTVV